MLLPIFSVRVFSSGRVELLESERERRAQWIRALAGDDAPNGRVCEMLLRRQPRQRTSDQNRYLHKVPFELIADHTGHSLAEVKRLCLAARFGAVGVDERGWPVPVVEHTSSLTVDEGSSLIEFLPAWALDTFQGRLEIPLPHQVEYRL